MLAVGVCVETSVGELVAVRVAVAVAELVGVIDGVEVGDGLGVAVAVGVGESSSTIGTEVTGETINRRTPSKAARTCRSI